MSDTTRAKLEVILSEYAAMRIHQQVAIDRIEQVYAQQQSATWDKSQIAAYMLDTIG